MTCKDCYHYKICGGFLPSDLDEDVWDLCAKGKSDEIPDIEDRCSEFKDKSLIVEPPCKVGDKLFRVVELLNGERFVVEGIAFEYTETFECGTTKKRIYFWAKGEEFTRRQYSLWCNLTDFGKTVFLTREEAEQALKNCTK